MNVRAAVTRIAQAASDLALGAVCAGCGEQPGLLCGDCRDDLLAAEPVLAAVPGMPEVPLAAAGAYHGPAGAAIVEHKERGRLPLAKPLGDALAVSVTALVAAGLGCRHGTGRPLVLVPAPSARPAVRHRGHDPLLRVVRRAAATLRRSGQETSVITVLRHARAVADQAGLDRRARQDNLRGAVAVRPAAAALFRGRCLVVADDVVTTGATLAECASALRQAGLAPCGAAVIAAAG